MTQKQLGAVGVSISGTDADAVHATTAVIHHALESKGFTQVQVTNLDQVVRGEKSTTLQAPANLLDTLRSSKPHLFNVPISITHSSSLESDEVGSYQLAEVMSKQGLGEQYAAEQAASANSLESAKNHTKDALASLVAHQVAHTRAVNDATDGVVFETPAEEVDKLED